ncbi:peptidoglycan DD-metalloendopeptidase family protein [Streptomyces sp. NPDC046215]|uniref:M23 family metallopeptidase n=1 Tax=Streptomyces sp. NPDC046215 TaxID=3155774 RepID=UPI0031D5A687
MNDRHPSAGPSPTGPAQDLSYGHYTSYEEQSAYQGHPGYDGTDTGQWNATGWGHSPDASWGGDTSGQWGITGQTQTWDFTGYDAGQPPAETGQWDTSGQWDVSGQWNTAEQSATGQWDASGQWDTSGQWDANSWNATGAYDTATAHQEQPGQSGHSEQWTAQAPDQTWDTAGTGEYRNWDTSGQWEDLSGQQTQTWDTSAYAAAEEAPPEAQPDAQPTPTVMVDLSGAAPAPVPGARSVADAETRTMSVVEPDDLPEPTGPSAADAPSRQDIPGQSRGRRKGTPPRAGYRPRRKALLTVAVPSVAVMGVAGIAAASVSGGGDKGDAKQTQAASTPDVPAVPSIANSKLDTQLAGLSRGADDFATRANRTQERIDLKARQEEEKKRKAEEAARKEAERPKFALPVAQHGLSAAYGQAGVNWMSVHTGIDFPVGYGTPVMAATDGTVRTQYNVAYGNMAIVTSPDGTETWYCHLSSTKLRSGQVKAGDVIAYSGSSGNSTGPHLHFEVRPGGSAVDPVPWLRGQGLDPT